MMMHRARMITRRVWLLKLAIGKSGGCFQLSLIREVMKIKRVRIALVLVLIAGVIFILISDCTKTGNPTTPLVEKSSDNATADQSNRSAKLPVLKVGFLTDMTGASSWYGRAMNTLGRAVVDTINKEGIKGFSKMEVTTYDTHSNQITACEQVTKAKEDKMDVVWGSWVEAQLIPYINNLASIPYVMNNNTGLKLLTNDNRWVINPNATSWDYGLATSDFFKRNRVRTWAITGQGWDEGWLDAWAEGIKYGLKDSDIKCVWDKEVPAYKTDWAEEINEWQKLKPDALVIANPGEGAFSIIKQMKDGGYWPKYVIFDPMTGGDYTVIKNALGKDYMLNLIAPTNSDVESPVWKEFATKHLEFDYFPYGFSAEIWDTLHLIKVAAEKIGPNGVKDPKVFMDALRNSSYNGAMGHTFGPFRENGLLKKVTVSFVQCVEGPPDWTDLVDFHWEPIFKTEISKQLSRDEAYEVWPDLKKRLEK
jgi:ABC-type branched-subunit amino acid transport system substrate-binding protein